MRLYALGSMENTPDLVRDLSATQIEENDADDQPEGYPPTAPEQRARNEGSLSPDIQGTGDS